ncbi:MAG: HDOD domain-containing protein [Gammaproteobacteria bacterium]|nr:HDOD domain-containing protein [Gammaproteobacteria bacterium]
MFNVLFIDDDDFMLRALLRLAKRLRPDWCFMTSSQARGWQDDIGSQSKLDLVICDYLMPQLNGDRVLADVADFYPGAVRALLTGDTTEEVVCNASKIAHFVLCKPFNERDILQLFMSVELTHALPVSTEVREMLGNSALLMPLPSVVKKVRDVLLNEQFEPADIVDVIQHDPVITARILQLANSAFMGFSRTTVSLEEAINRLGVKLTTAIITSIAFEQASAALIDKNTHRKINDDAFELAVNSRQLSRKLGYKQEAQEELFVAALLTAIGALITATPQWQEKYRDLYSDWPPIKRDLVVSAFMLTLWGYADSLRQTVLSSAAPDFSEPEGNLALVLFLARQRLANNGVIPTEVLNRLPDLPYRQLLSKIT